MIETDRIIRKRFSYAYLPVFTFMLYLSLEMQNTLYTAYAWFALTVSCALILLAFFILIVVTNNVFISGILLSIILLLFYTANFYRLQQTGWVLIPTDINLARHIRGMVAFTNIHIMCQPVCSILCVVALNVPLYHASKCIKLDVRKRAATFVTSCLIVFLLFFTVFSKMESELDISASATHVMSYNEVYAAQGAFLGFFLVGFADDMEPLEGYDREYIEELTFHVVNNAGLLASIDGTRPNIIVVMSEAFWDPARLPHVTFSDDPLPNFRKLQGAATSGNVVAPSFGGMTSHTEFEFLTGNAMRFAGFGDIPYYDTDTYINIDSGRSLPEMFRHNGYQTVALHTYTASFFCRDEVYPMLGFDNFIAEEDMPDAFYKGSLDSHELIADEYFCDMLIEIVEDADDPLFLFGITMQNHTPFLPDKYDLTRIKADSSGILSSEDIAYLETYLEGVNDADTVLGRLYDFTMGFNEPTIVLYFGDHLPGLTMGTGIYLDLGYISEARLDDLSAEDAYKMYTTPYIAFSNYMELPASWGDVSPYFLGALLADAAGIELNYYYVFLLQAFEKFQAMNGYLSIVDGIISEMPHESNPGIEMFEAFQYDTLFGAGYADVTMASFP